MCIVGQSSPDNSAVSLKANLLPLRITTQKWCGFSCSRFSELLESVVLCLSLVLGILGGCPFRYFLSLLFPVPRGHPPFTSSFSWVTLDSCSGLPLTWVESTDERVEGLLHLLPWVPFLASLWFPPHCQSYSSVCVLATCPVRALNTLIVSLKTSPSVGCDF